MHDRTSILDARRSSASATRRSTHRGGPRRSPGWRLLAAALSATALCNAAAGQRPLRAAAIPSPDPCQTPAATTPEGWQPKRYAPELDQDENFVEDAIDVLAPWTQIDVLLCLNACPRQSDLARFSGHGFVGYVSPYLTVVWLQGVSASSAVALGQDPRVAFVQLDHECELTSDVSVPAIKVSTSADYPGENLEDAYPSLDGTGVNIAIIDTGIDEHESLPAWKDVGGWDFATLPGVETNPDDVLGHGTHVAGIAAGTGGPNGPRGVAPGAGLVDMCVNNPATGKPSESRVIAAIDKCIDKQVAWDIRVINLSLGSAYDSSGGDAMAQAASRAVQAGIVVCAAIGNDDMQKIASPAAADDVIAVSALHDHGTIDRSDDDRWTGATGGSNFGPRLDDGDSDTADELKPEVSAPGASILAPRHDSLTGYVQKSGTSMAAPHVAGLAAILVQAEPNRTPSEVRELLVDGAAGAWDPEFGFGEIDAFRSVLPRNKLLPSDGTAEDEFGYAVAVSGDRVLVGAHGDEGIDGSPGVGSAYVFEWDGSSWVQTAKLTASDQAQNNFGVSVALSGDRAIVGANWDSHRYGDDAALTAGAAYVFEWNGSAWVQTAKLIASDGATNDQFGISVALSGDRAIVGAWQDAAPLGNSGSAYVFEKSGSSWVQTAKITASDGGHSDHFGESVSLSGDRAVIGAFHADNLAFVPGSAYVFEWTGSHWHQRAKLTASDGADVDFFGHSVAVSGSRVIVGAWGDDDLGLDSGSAYVFEKSGSSWVQRAKLTASDGALGDQFGVSVALSGDRAIVGASQDPDYSGMGRGSAYVFEWNGSSWVQSAKLTASDGASGDQFGVSVALSEARAIVGAFRDDDLGTNSGSAYMFD